MSKEPNKKELKEMYDEALKEIVKLKEVSEYKITHAQLYALKLEHNDCMRKDSVVVNSEGMFCKIHNLKLG